MNINQAINQANRLQRALTILKEGYKLTDELGDGSLIAVCKPGRLAASYWITDGECDCPDRAKGNICKHELAWDVLKAEEEMMEALCKEWEARQLIEA